MIKTLLHFIKPPWSNGYESGLSPRRSRFDSQSELFPFILQFLFIIGDRLLSDFWYIKTMQGRKEWCASKYLGHLLPQLLDLPWGMRCWGMLLMMHSGDLGGSLQHVDRSITTVGGLNSYWGWIFNNLWCFPTFWAARGEGVQKLQNQLDFFCQFLS